MPVSTAWTGATVHYLREPAVCARCGSPGFAVGRPCPDCGADFSGPIGLDLASAAEQAARALEWRQQIIDRVPTVVPAIAATTSGNHPTAPDGPGLASAPPPLPVGTPEPGAPGRDPASSQISVQSVLAVAGAGLVAVAAIVFTFFNPDLSDFGVRTAVVGGVTALFTAGAALLARRGLTFSAEAVAALALVFVALDVWALAQLMPPGDSVWLTVGAGTLIGSAAAIAVAAAVRVRVWLWAGLIGVAVSPAVFAASAAEQWIGIAGTVAVGFTALALVPLTGRLERRFAGHLRAEAVSSTALRILVVGVALLQVVAAVLTGTEADVLWGAVTVATLAVLAALSARRRNDPFWALLTGALAVSATALAMSAVPLAPQWLIAVTPFAGSLGAVAVSIATRSRSGTQPMRVGAWVVAVVCAAPAGAVATAQVLLVVTGDAPVDLGLAAVPGVLALTAGSAVAFAATGPGDAFARRVRLIGLWAGAVTVASLVCTPALTPWAQAGLSVSVAVLGSLGVLALRRGRRRPAGDRPGASVQGASVQGASVLGAPLTALAHLALIIAAAVSWSAAPITVVAGSVIVASLVLVARTVPARFRPAHVAAGFGFALLVFARGLDLLGLDLIPLLCLVTGLASICALGATLIRRVPTGAWYALLGVTAVPFLVGVVSVVLVRSGWTALSTGVTFALAVTLVVTTRPGLDRRVRTAAGAILVPALAVMVICLGAELLAMSASPVTLPIIAAIVAAALATARSLPERLPARVRQESGRLVGLAIELSAYLTGALAVLLALVRSAAGLGTTAIVLVILGAGAATAAAREGRRLPWVVAGVSWTGALWSALGLVGISLPEAYLVPPAAAAVALGLVLARRGRAAGWWFCTIGLASGILPSLVLLALVGPSAAVSPVPWRTVGLAGVAAALLLAVRSRRMPGAGRLRTDAVVLALFAAAGPVAQAVRIGRGLDPLSSSAGGAMLSVLLLTAISVALALVGGRQLAFTTDGVSASGPSPRTLTPAGYRRRCFVPAAVLAVVGPIAAVDGGWTAIVVLWLLTAALLAVMLVTVWRARRRAVAAPPVWLLFGLAWCTAVAGWSARELRVEAFSLPLGLALTAAGILALRQPVTPQRPTATTWPVAFSGSWRVLGPGIVVTLLPSILATATDPLTGRAILVIALALVAILLGSLLKLAAPFVLGILVLPVENVIVFVVQIGRSIGAAPWWMTLATAGAVLLLIAVTSERRAGAARSVGARLRDLA